MKSVRDVYRLGDQICKPGMLPGTDPATAKLLLRRFGVYDPERMVAAVGKHGAACPKLLTEEPERAVELMAYRMCHVMPPRIRKRIEAEADRDGEVDEEELAEAVDAAVVNECVENIRSIVAEGEVFLYAQVCIPIFHYGCFWRFPFMW